MSCRVTAGGAGAVDAPVVGRGTADYHGRLLTREQALAHPRLGELWALVDAVVTTVPEAHRAIHGHG